MDSGESDNKHLTWGQRHGLTVMMVVLGLAFVLVIVVQKLT